MKENNIIITDRKCQDLIDGSIIGTQYSTAVSSKQVKKKQKKTQQRSMKQRCVWFLSVCVLMMQRTSCQCPWTTEVEGRNREWIRVTWSLARTAMNKLKKQFLYNLLQHALTRLHLTQQWCNLCAHWYSFNFTPLCSPNVQKGSVCSYMFGENAHKLGV